MKNKKIKTYIYNNINTLNNYLFVLIILFSIYYTSYIVYTFNLNYEIILFLIINCLFLLVFYVIIRIYEEKNIENIKIISSLLNINKKDINNNKIYKLFKRLFIKNNLLNQDYNALKENFEKFISKNALKDITKWINEKIHLWKSVEQELHIMFIDISGFTNLSENITPNKSLLLLNIYFDWIVEISKKYWWYVDKFLWDWIMIIFEDKYSDGTLQTAIEIIDLVKKINIANFKHKIDIWIWINSWKATLWTIGSKDRMDITIIWDTVNTASRIENQTRIEKEWILFSEKTFDLIEKKNLFNIEEIWEKKLKWKKNEIKIFWIVEKKIGRRE